MLNCEKKKFAEGVIRKKMPFKLMKECILQAITGGIYFYNKIYIY